jgi:hypothetical protein
VNRFEIETPRYPIPEIAVIAPGQVHVGLVQLADEGLLPLAAHPRLGVLLRRKLFRFERFRYHISHDSVSGSDHGRPATQVKTARDVIIVLEFLIALCKLRNHLNEQLAS